MLSPESRLSPSFWDGLGEGFAPVATVQGGQPSVRVWTGAPGDRADRVSDPWCWVCPLDLAGRLILENVPRFRWSVAELRVS